MMNNKGLYIHVPFCLSKCPYCDFYSVGYTKERAEDYKNAVIRNLRHYHKEYGLSFDTVYFGGGTPILLYEHIGEILHNVRLTDNAEITLEANPCVSSEKALKSLIDCGVNRISFGVQSLSDRELSFLGRRHTEKEAIAAIERAYSIGFRNISADLMLGLSGQTRETLGDSIDRLSALPINHISAYMLKIEEGTPFSVMELSLPDEEETAKLYLFACERLEKKSFFQYEISNFSRKGTESRHNLKYWRSEEYLGIGPAAHSYLKGKRFSVGRDIDSFLTSDVQETVVTDDNPGGFEEYAMLKLRLREGLSYSECEGFGISRDIIQNKLKAIPESYIEQDEKGIRLTPEGFLLSNTIIARLIY